MGVGGRGSRHASSDRSLGCHAERDVSTSIGQAHRPKPWSSAVKAAASGCSPRKGALGKGCLLPKLHLCLQWAWCPCVVHNLHNWTQTLPERHWARTLEETHSCPLPPCPHQGLCLSGNRVQRDLMGVLDRDQRAPRPTGAGHRSAKSRVCEWGEGEGLDDTCTQRVQEDRRCPPRTASQRKALRSARARAATEGGVEGQDPAQPC